MSTVATVETMSADAPATSIPWLNAEMVAAEVASMQKASEETTPAEETAADQFPDDDDDGDDEDTAIPWRDVPRYTWLYVIRMRKVKVVDKVYKILTLRHRDCTTRTAWSTGLIATAIDEFLAEHPQDDTTQ